MDISNIKYTVTAAGKSAGNKPAKEYPTNIATENKENSLLKFICKSCNYSETVEQNTQETNLVYRNQVKLGQSSVKIDPGIINDPTYSRTKNKTCPKCGYHEAIFFQNPNINDPGMKLVFVCCNKNDGIYCGHSWFEDEEK